MGILYTRVKADCFCAFCSSQRTIYAKKHVDLVNWFWTVLFAASVGVASGHWWDPRSILVVSVGMVVSEAFIYIRWRSSVVCRACGFDPVLYRKSPEKASEKVRAFYEERALDPAFLLSRSPLLDVYRRQVKTSQHNEMVRSRVPTQPSKVALSIPPGTRPSPALPKI